MLHIGMGKTGTTHLQETLTRLRGPLGERGVLYPNLRRKPNHNVLVLGARHPERWPRGFRQLYPRPEDGQREFNIAWSQLVDQIETASPEVTVLSGEFFFYDLREGSLHERLGQLADSVTVCAYVRRPSDGYLSILQQALKASSKFSAPGPLRVRGTIDSYRQRFDQVLMRAYDSSSMVNGDIVDDFLTNFVPQAVPLRTPPRDIQRSNESMSAEAMQLIQDHRIAHVGRELDNVATQRTNRLLDVVRSMDSVVPGRTRPKLHAAVRVAVDRASSDLLWLRDEGVTFAEIDYENVDGAGAAMDGLVSVSDVCEVDQARLSGLRTAVINALLA